jgi:hypothetical protein
MAKTGVTLRVDTFKPREVSEVQISFQQAIDKEGQPTGLPRGGKIVVTVKALNDGNCELFNWMVDKSLAKDGCIEFVALDKKQKEIVFKGAYCIDFLEIWKDSTKPADTKDDISHTEKITISCKEIMNQSVSYANEWA